MFFCECSRNMDVDSNRSDLFNLPFFQCKKCKMKSAMEWKPIKTAPRLGRILLTDGEHVGEGHFYRLQNKFVYDGYAFMHRELKDLTHWMPLPQPPIT